MLADVDTGWRRQLQTENNEYTGKCLSLWFRFDQHPVGEGAEGGADAEQRSEGGVSGATSVKAEDELVEVGWQVLPAEAVVDTQGPALEVGEDPVHPGEHDMSGHRADGVGVVVDIRDAGIAGPSVGLGGRSCGDIGLDEGVQACGGEVSDRRSRTRPGALPTTSTAPA